MADDVARLSAALADRYRIERELGQGGMATVYLAHDLKHDRPVAIKVLHPDLAAALGAQRFLSEIKVTANLQHPHILSLHDSGEADGLLFYVMPFVEGESLRDRLNREKPLPVDDAVRIAGQVASALDYAHRHGVIHRDIKPENILLHDGSALVADFGIALAVQSASGERMTQTGLSLGTPHYMSPEQAMGEKQIDARSDVYALGAVLYEMLTGDPPFTGSTVQAVVAKVMSAEAEPVTMVRKTTPPAVAAAVHRALEKLPADRFATAADFGAALAGTAGPGSTHGYRGLPGAVAPRARLTALAPWAVAVVAVLAAVAGWVWHRPSGTGTPLLHVELQAPVGTEFSENRFAALSPDGMRLAFVGLRSTGGRVLWIRDLQTGLTDSLHEADGAEAPFWSPDGTALGYYARGSIWRIQDDGTTPQRLCPTADPGGSWNRAGVILFTRNGRPATVNSGGGACTPVGGAWADTSLHVVRPAWLPDGRHFAAENDLEGSIVISDASGAPPRTFIPNAGDVQFVAPNLAVFTNQVTNGASMLAQRFDPGSFALLGDRTTLVASIRTAALVPSYTVVSSALAYLVPSRGDAGPVIVDAEGALKDSVGIMGTFTFRHAHGHPWLALGGVGLWRYDLDRKTAAPILPPQTTNAGVFTFPVWSPGDSVLAVAQWAAQCRLLLVRPAANTDTVVMETRNHSLAACPNPSDWTADGRFIVMNMAPDSAANRAEIWSYEVATGKRQKLVSVDGAASAGVVSPDERWLAYASDETGRLQVYVHPFRRTGASVAVSPLGGGTPRWSRDGRALYYITPDGRVVRVPVAPGAVLKLGSPETLFRAPRWSMRLYADQQGGVQLTTPFDVSPDGTQFYLRQSVEVTPDATLVLGWQALLGRSKSNAGGQQQQ